MAALQTMMRGYIERKSCRVVHREINLLLNVSQTKLLIVAFIKKKEAKTHNPVCLPETPELIFIPTLASRLKLNFEW